MGLILCSLLIFSVNPDDQVHNLIDKLGSPSYTIRENASIELSKLGKKIIPTLRSRAENTSDLEIKWRCLEVERFYFRKCFEDITPIWMLPKRYRFINGKDIGKSYYEKARVLFNEVKTNYLVQEDDYTDLNVALKATTLYLLDQTENSDEYDDVGEIKSTMSSYYTNVNSVPELYYDFHFTPSNEDFDNLPLPIEDIIQMINDSGYTEAIVIE